MKKYSTVFILVLLVILLLYFTSTYRIIIYNNSGQTIEKLKIESRWMNKEIRNFEHSNEFNFTLVALYDKHIKIIVENPNQIRSASFELRYPLLGAQYQQVEISFGAEIKLNTLGR